MNKCDAQICVSIDAQGRSVRGIVAYQQKGGCASRGEPSNTSAALESTEATAAETAHAPAAAQAERSRSACGHLLVESLAVRITVRNLLAR